MNWAPWAVVPISSQHGIICCLFSFCLEIILQTSAREKLSILLINEIKSWFCPHHWLLDAHLRRGEPTRPRGGCHRQWSTFQVGYTQNKAVMALKQEQLLTNCATSLYRALPSAHIILHWGKGAREANKLFHRVHMLQPTPSKSSLCLAISAGCLMNGFN